MAIYTPPPAPDGPREWLEGLFVGAAAIAALISGIAGLYAAAQILGSF